MLVAGNGPAGNYNNLMVRDKPDYFSPFFDLYKSWFGRGLAKAVDFGSRKVMMVMVMMIVMVVMVVMMMMMMMMMIMMIPGVLQEAGVPACAGRGPHLNPSLTIN
jgi:hypothetical protein